MVNSMNAEKGMLCWSNPGIKKVGKCQAPHSTPRIRLAESIDLVASSRGRAYPRQPISSPTTRTKRIGSRIESWPSATGVGAPSRRCTPAVTSARTAGSPRATTYQRTPTRQRRIRPNQSLKPVLPSAAATTITAASAGPKRPTKPTIGDTCNEGIHQPRKGVRQDEERSKGVASNECHYGSHRDLFFGTLLQDIVTRCIFSYNELPRTE